MDRTNTILPRMLERLYAALASGPSLNCRPQHSRQRVDLAGLAALSGPAPAEALCGLLDRRAQRFTAPLAAKAAQDDAPANEPGTDPQSREELKAAEAQRTLVRKLATIADDAASFEQETGAQVLFVGFPLLSLPPGSGRAGTRRILAPVAFVPVSLEVKRGRTPSICLEACGEGIDHVMPNTALLAWVEQQTGTRLRDLFADEEASDPWREVNELTAAIARALSLTPPAAYGPGLSLAPAPRTDDEESKQPAILPCAVAGLFPLSNQSLVRDMEALAEGEDLHGPIESFLSPRVALAHAAGPDAPKADRVVAEERLVSHADPCQARAVRLARHSQGLVIHGPPGTGKSQTIANAIGDHLARGERVLVVCDKRTALDVVKYRLDALGLGQLCAVVHDAQRDQKDLYLSIREQLDGLAETKADPAAAATLAEADSELTTLHDELRRHDRALSERPGGIAPSFHELAGEWLSLQPATGLDAATADLRTERLEVLAGRERDVREALDRGLQSGWTDHPFREAAGVDLAGWLSQPLDEHRHRLERCRDAARAADETAHESLLPFDTTDLAAQAAARESLAGELEAIVATPRGTEMLARWASTPEATVREARESLTALTPHTQELESGTLDPELGLVVQSAPLALPEVLQGLVKLERWLGVARRWWGFLFLFRRFAAGSVLARLGLTLSVLAAERASRFLSGFRARTLLSDLHRRLLATGEPPLPAGLLPDEELRTRGMLQRAIFAVFQRLATEPALASVASLRSALVDPSRHAAVLEGLRRSPARARALAGLTSAIDESKLFSAGWRGALDASLRQGARKGELFASLLGRISGVEGLLRARALVAGLPAPLGGAVTRLLDLGAPVEAGWQAVRKAALSGELAARVEQEPLLRTLDGARLQASHDRVLALESRKRTLVRDAICDRWLTRQRERLLASTGSRLNGAGAELRRRLLVRGERVLKVRQVIAAGAATEGGDPLFDLRPVWMASPGTVAQIFPRQPVFDVVIFDESSQCRLEEALPVLTRAKRVVVAGDPKQLPPTRFFESAVVQSEGGDAEDEQGLFEAQQAETEDLLTAALNLEVEQCYLDVHYRSRSADLIEFSNRSFYESRLQAIPGHPSHRATIAPLALRHVGGVYHKRQNPAEAAAVVSLVRELLARPTPPSIGIACFNLTQRDAIVEALDEAAAADPTFGAQLAQARTRRGAGSFEGLFVKNLENVQGDERDHIIISTTYGPDPSGRFYRRFGPLGMVGGGRRLNVLVTRAREAVHLLTSIPREIYGALPPVEAGQTPGGAWLLFSYLQYAEEVQRLFAQQGELMAAEKGATAPVVNELPSGAPSSLAAALAQRLAGERRLSSDVHWGNDGFCVDVALHHPRHPDAVTVGVLCDGTRYPKAADRVEWDLFRTEVHRAQGWKLLRLWSPQLVRDPQGALDAIAAEHKAILGAEGPSHRAVVAKAAEEGRTLH